MSERHLQNTLERLASTEAKLRQQELTIDGLRDAIDIADSIIVDLINRRATLATSIGEIKKRDGIPVYIPSREKEVIGNVVAKGGGPLPSESIRRIYERIIDETRTMVRHNISPDE